MRMDHVSLVVYSRARIADTSTRLLQIWFPVGGEAIPGLDAQSMQIDLDGLDDSLVNQHLVLLFQPLKICTEATCALNEREQHCLLSLVFFLLHPQQL